MVDFVLLALLLFITCGSWPVSIHFSCGLRKREGYRSQQTLPAGKPKQSFQCANFFGFVCGLVYALDRLFAFITELV
jgi:hypothetical protein